MWYEWRPYVTVAERRQRAMREVARLRKKGNELSPVAVEGRTIASTFWGKAWCDNLQRYSDYANRLPRGRTYVRNGSVLDLQIAAAEVKALVNGSEIYRVRVKVATLPRPRWKSLCRDCAGAIDSLVELLQGHLSQGVMERICQAKTGLFPAAAEIEFSCSCPDWASMCKHVAAVLYGIGARLDQQPELLFKLRNVDEKDLLSEAGSAVPLVKSGPGADRLLGTDGLSELFGLEMDLVEPAPAAPSGRRRAAGTRVGTAARSVAKKAPGPVGKAAVPAVHSAAKKAAGAVGGPAAPAVRSAAKKAAGAVGGPAAPALRSAAKKAAGRKDLARRNQRA